MVKSAKSQYKNFREHWDASRIIMNIAEPLMQNCVREWENHVRTNFETEGGRVGGWKPLHDATKNLRRKLGFSERPILSMRGTLKKSWHVTTNKGFGEYGVKLEFDSEPDWFTGDDLAKKHHEGGVGYNPFTKSYFTVPKRELFDRIRLRSIFENEVSKPFDQKLKMFVAEMMGE